MLTEQVVYFENPGGENTEHTLRLAKERAAARGITRVVLASTSGGTARLAMQAFAGTGIQLVVVPWQFGFADDQPFAADLVPALEAEGHRVHFGTMLFHTEAFYGSRAPRALANLLRAFCEGVKVAVEILLMAADGGAVSTGEKVISIAGTGAGADTALVATASPSTKLAKLRINEIICKPL